MRVLITGVTGFVGSHMADYLLAKGDVEVFGSYRWRSRMDNLEHLRRESRLVLIGENSTVVRPDQLEALIEQHARPQALNLLPADMTDANSMRCLIGALRPDRIFHLAAQSYVPTSQNSPANTLQTNILGELNLLEAVREVGIDPLIHIAGSSEEYGLVHPDEVPITEDNPLRPLSPYGVSKVAQDLLAYQYHQTHGLRTIRTRGFNHTGPRRGHVFVTSGQARAVAEIEKEMRPPVLEVGDTTSRRDWTDVRDFVRAYWLVLERGEPGEVYNVGSGNAYSIGELLHILLGLSPVKIEVRSDPSRFRPSDVRLLEADASKLRKRTGWKPEIPFAQTMEDLLNYWRERV